MLKTLSQKAMRNKTASKMHQRNQFKTVQLHNRFWIFFQILLTNLVQ